MTARLSTALSRTVSWFVILPVSTFTCFAIGAESKEEPARKALNERVQPVIDALDKLCRQKTIYMIGPTKARRLAELVREKKPKVVVECGTAVGYSGLDDGTTINGTGLISRCVKRVFLAGLWVAWSTPAQVVSRFFSPIQRRQKGCLG